MLNSFRPKTNCEEEAKFLQDRLNVVEKNLALLCGTFGQYARKTARVRDKGDELVKAVLSYSSSETVNKSLSIGLDSFADCMSTLSDYGDARTQALELKVVGELSRYHDICKKAKEEVRNVFGAREREVQRKRQLDRIRDRNPKNRQQILQAETELVKATAELSKTVRTIEDKTSSFERQKLHDVKSILLDFISIEMGFHAKALEVMSRAFTATEAIDEESDLKHFRNTQEKLDWEFKKSLRLPSGTLHGRSPGPRTSIFRSTQSLGSMGTMFSTSHNKRIPGIGHSRDKLNKSEETLDSMKRNSGSVTEDTSDSGSGSATSDDDEEEEDVESDALAVETKSGLKKAGK
ncbi:CBY1-interacting BAR domain-containing protein 1 [Euwallacea similis]|uniref:CBY1-interacting BAR domain-containing protein 1 n=1 Tax=Euwallacea similis TaxID=1736056 RepID=UPI00344F0E59